MSENLNRDRRDALKVISELMYGSPGIFPPESLGARCSDTHESIIGVQCGNCERECLANRLPVTSASTYEGLHVRLCYLIPDHVPCIEVGAFSHRLEGILVVQKLSCGICN